MTVLEYELGDAKSSGSILELGLTFRADNVSVYTVLDKGLRDLEDMCDVVIEKFEAAREDFHKSKSGDTEMADA